MGYLYAGNSYLGFLGECLPPKCGTSVGGTGIGGSETKSKGGVGVGICCGCGLSPVIFLLPTLSGPFLGWAGGTII